MSAAYDPAVHGWVSWDLPMSTQNPLGAGRWILSTHPGGLDQPRQIQPAELESLVLALTIATLEVEQSTCPYTGEPLPAKLIGGLGGRSKSGPNPIHHARTLTLDPETLYARASKSDYKVVTREPGATPENFIQAAIALGLRVQSGRDPWSLQDPEVPRPVVAFTVEPVTDSRVRERLITKTIRGLSAEPQAFVVEEDPDLDRQVSDFLEAMDMREPETRAGEGKDTEEATAIPDRRRAAS